MTGPSARTLAGNRPPIEIEFQFRRRIGKLSFPKRQMLIQMPALQHFALPYCEVGILQWKLGQLRRSVRVEGLIALGEFPEEQPH